MSGARSFKAANDSAPNDLSAWWLPFTANRSFKQRPRIVSRAKDMYYYTPEGRADDRRLRGPLVRQCWP